MENNTVLMRPAVQDVEFFCITPCGSKLRQPLAHTRWANDRTLTPSTPWTLGGACGNDLAPPPCTLGTQPPAHTRWEDGRTLTPSTHWTLGGRMWQRPCPYTLYTWDTCRRVRWRPYVYTLCTLDTWGRVGRPSLHLTHLGHVGSGVVAPGLAPSTPWIPWRVSPSVTALQAS